MNNVNALVLAVLLAALPALPAHAGPAGQRHDGTVRGVDTKAGVLTLDEIGADAHHRTLHVRVAPGARVMLSERVPRAADAQHQFKDTPITLAAIKPGDFVVVQLSGTGTKAVAERVMVTARAAAH